MKGKIEHLHPELVSLLERLEDFMGFELTITSGQRTQEHNVDPKVGGVPDSEHTYDPAEGVDVFCQQSTTRYKVVGWLYDNEVKRIGIGDKFVHIGIAKDKPQNVMWDYYPEI